MTSHLYGGIPAKWQVTLTVQDMAGLTDTTIQLVLFETVPRLTFQPSDPGIGQQVIFNASTSISYNATNPIKEYDWNFGDGTSSTGVWPTHTYSTAATYRVVLTLLTSYGNPSASKTLKVGTSLVYSVITDEDSYAPGDTVHAKLNAANQGTQPATFVFIDACSGFQFQITNSTGNLVFTNVPPPFAPCAQVVTIITIQPGQTLTVATLDWKQVNMQGQQVPSGSYTITGVIHYESPYQTIPVASKSITIRTADFHLTINPPSTSIPKGSSTVLTITATAQNGFAGTVDLSATIQPTTKHSPTLSPIVSITLTSTNPSGTTTLTISTTRSTNAGTYTITVTGTSGTTSHSIAAIILITTK
jgi:PKD repeat protein